MLTYYNQTEDQPYSLNEHFEARLDEHHVLITTRHGGWIILSNEEFNLFKSQKLDEEVFKKLEEVGVILTPNNMKKIVFELTQQHHGLFRFANYHVISVTNRCNLRCVYCHPDAKPKRDDMDRDVAKKILDFIFEAPVKGNQIVIEGGEPLLKFDLVQYIFEEATKRSRERKMKLRFSFGTNLTLMDEDIAKQLSKLGIMPCTSLDGPKELHDKQRPYINGRGSYEEIVHWIKVLREDFNINIHALPVMTKYSLDYDPREIIDTYINANQNEIFFKPFRPTGRGFTGVEKLTMDPKDFFEFWKNGIEYCIDLCKKGTPIRELNALYFVQNFLSPIRFSMCHRRPCGAGMDILSYNCDGTIIACDVARILGVLDLGHVDSDNFMSIREKALSLSTITPDSIPVCSSCEYMSYCNTCLCSNFGFHNELKPKIPRDFECNWRKQAYKYLFKKFLDKEDAKILRSWARRGYRYPRDFIGVV